VEPSDLFGAVVVAERVVDDHCVVGEHLHHGVNITSVVRLDVRFDDRFMVGAAATAAEHHCDRSDQKQQWSQSSCRAVGFFQRPHRSPSRRANERVLT